MSHRMKPLHGRRAAMRRGFLTLIALVAAAAAALLTTGCQQSRGDVTAPPSPQEDTPQAEATIPFGSDAEEPITAEDAATAPDVEEQELAEARQVLAERERELAEREAALAAREAAERERKIAEREAALKAKEAALKAKEEELAERAEAAEAERELAAKRYAAPPPEEPPAPPPPRRVAVLVPAGSEIEVEFLDALSSETSVPGDRFRTRLVDDVTVDGMVAIPAGSRVLGTVTEAVSLKKVGGRARLALDFDTLELPTGERVEVHTRFAEQGRSETKKDAATIGGATAGGALLGRILDRGRDKGKGTVLGAIVGAAVGTAIAARTPGEELVIEPGAVLGLYLDEPVRTYVER